MADEGDNESQCDERENSRERSDEIMYRLDDTPPIHLSLFLGLQQVMMTIPGTLSIPLILSELLCADDPAPVRARLMSIAFFMCGLATVLQTTVGVRLPIIQGGSHSFLPPVITMMALERWRCADDPTGGSDGGWMERMREIQGNLMLASLTQVVLGSTGLLGFLLRFIGPLTITPTIALIGLSLTGVVTRLAHVHWPVAFLTIALVVVFALLLGRYNQPVPVWTRQKGCHFTRYPLLQLFSVLLAMSVSWLTCYVLTATDVIPNNVTHPAYLTRTDTRLHVIREAPWFTFPYPFQFGMPTISAGGFLGMLAATLASIIESVGDYFAAARVSQAPAPPSSAVNRGIAMEGVASIVSGMVGAGHATTSYSSNIGAIAVASRRVFHTAGVLLLLCGVLGKVGAFFTLLPEPVVGGAMATMLAMVTSVGLTTVLYANMSTLRNLAIFGLAIMLGLTLSPWITENPDTISTGSLAFDQILIVLLGTPMCVGGFIGFLLDNIVPGTIEERGLVKWRVDAMKSATDESPRKLYDIPYISDVIRKVPMCSFVPMSPSYRERDCSSCWPLGKKRKWDLKENDHAEELKETLHSENVAVNTEPV
ncbi:hypothetical protein BaRGS_00000073 [Batillaria attramentaria]|uniref:Solute carrier family 23 member 2 n=1 Tax=Batillaria attramentaria TaxID=370345 RepID=A0ABD0MAA4_9CAEN